MESDAEGSVQRVVQDVLRPLIEADGGQVELVEANSKRVVIRLSGACTGCPGKPYTLLHIVEPALRKALGPDVEVETLDGGR